MEYCFLKDCNFYVYENDVALEVYEDFKADKVVYDGKNTIVLLDNARGSFLVQNIVPEIRELFVKDKDLMIIHTRDDEIEDVYELKINVNKNSIFEDDFYDKAKAFFEKVYNEAKATAGE